ncbi:MAG: hypothetical protein ACHQX1_00905 [Candidatus Micrarchaeales archaeon]
MANRLLTINIRNYLVNQPRRKRQMRVSNYLKTRIAHSTNLRIENVKISKELNSLIIKRHVKSMKPLKVNINIDKDKALVTPFVEKTAPTAPAPASSAAKQDKQKPTEQKQQPKPAEKKKEQGAHNEQPKKSEAAKEEKK